MTELSDDFDDDFDFSALTPSDSSALVTDVLPAAYNLFPPQELVLSIEDQGSSFFFHHFVTVNSTPPSSYAAFLPRLYNYEAASGLASNPLPGVITAIGMAGITNMQSSPTPAAMVATRQKHTSVLRALNAALQDSRTASTDSTLMAVMLLGLFEVRFPTLGKSSELWQSCSGCS